MVKSNLDKLREELDVEINGLLEEHCDNCEDNGVCLICFPNFIDLALKRQREAIEKDVEDIFAYRKHDDFVRILKEIAKLLKGDKK